MRCAQRAVSCACAVGPSRRLVGRSELARVHLERLGDFRLTRPTRLMTSALGIRHRPDRDASRARHLLESQATRLAHAPQRRAYSRVWVAMRPTIRPRNCRPVPTGVLVCPRVGWPTLPVITPNRPKSPPIQTPSGEALNGPKPRVYRGFGLSGPASSGAKGRRFKSSRARYRPRWAAGAAPSPAAVAVPGPVCNTSSLAKSRSFARAARSIREVCIWLRPMIREMSDCERPW